VSQSSPFRLTLRAILRHSFSDSADEMDTYLDSQLDKKKKKVDKAEQAEE